LGYYRRLMQLDLIDNIWFSYCGWRISGGKVIPVMCNHSWFAHCKCSPECVRNTKPEFRIMVSRLPELLYHQLSRFLCATFCFGARFFWKSWWAKSSSTFRFFWRTLLFKVWSSEGVCCPKSGFFWFSTLLNVSRQFVIELGYTGCHPRAFRIHGFPPPLANPVP